MNVPQSLETKLLQKTAHVAVVGLGYAGLPMAVEMARAGFTVLGYDVDTRKVKTVNAGQSPVSNVQDSDIAPLLDAQTLVASANPADLATVDIAVIAVPTPLTAAGDPDMRFVISAGSAIGSNLKPGMMVVLQSTCAPGTTTKLLAPAMESQSGLRAGEQFHLVFAPERIDPGNQLFTVSNTPKLVGGTTPEATRLACLFYSTFIDTVIPVSSPEVAEMAKLVENTFRFINISFANEMALLCDRMGVNVWEVIEAAKSKPFAFMAHYPSVGVGGHCIPVVPLYLQAAARQHGMSTELINAANEINHTMPVMIVDKLEAALASRGRDLLGAKLLVVGVTYKPDVADVRESAAVRVMEVALTRGAKVAYHDPLTPTLTISGDQVASTSITPDTLRAADVVLLATPHTTIDYTFIVKHAPLVVDTHSGLHPRVASNVINVWTPAARAAEAVALV